MKRLARCLLVVAALTFSIVAVAQGGKKWREMHKVEKSETIYGIARDEFFNTYKEC